MLLDIDLPGLNAPWLEEYMDTRQKASLFEISLGAPSRKISSGRSPRILFS
jgi:hypothetical protein